jgi:hypothetical protein
MKRLLIALTAALTFAAQAEPLAYIPNQGGGQIVFTSQVCVNNGKRLESLRRVFTFTRSGDMVEGCYYYDEVSKLLMVKWRDNGQQSVFPIGNVILFSER